MFTRYKYKGEKMFNYRDATLEDCVAHISSCSRQSVYSSKMYYKYKGEKEVADKIAKANNIAKIERMKNRLDVA